MAISDFRTSADLTVAQDKIARSIVAEATSRLLNGPKAVDIASSVNAVELSR